MLGPGCETLTASARAMAMAAVRDIVGIDVKFTLNTPDGLRKVRGTAQICVAGHVLLSACSHSISQPTFGGYPSAK